jgi:hypothetical protein
VRFDALKQRRRLFGAVKIDCVERSEQFEALQHGPSTDIEMKISVKSYTCKSGVTNFRTEVKRACRKDRDLLSVVAERRYLVGTHLFDPLLRGCLGLRLVVPWGSRPL